MVFKKIIILNDGVTCYELEYYTKKNVDSRYISVSISHYACDGSDFVFIDEIVKFNNGIFADDYFHSKIKELKQKGFR